MLRTAPSRVHEIDTLNRSEIPFALPFTFLGPATRHRSAFGAMPVMPCATISDNAEMVAVGLAPTVRLIRS